MFNELDSKIEAFVDDCDINLFSIIDMREFPEYRTELRELFNLLSTRNDGDAMAELVSKDDKFKSISRDTAELMRDFANVKLPNKDKEGNYNMCKAVIDLTNKGRAEGIKEGIKEGKKEGIKEGKIEGQTEALAFSIKSIMQSFNQSFEQACAVLKIDAKDMERYRKIMDQGDGVSGPLLANGK